MRTVTNYINELADSMREDGSITIDGSTYTIEQFPEGFWRKIAKEVNYLSITGRNVSIESKQTIESKQRDIDW